MTNPLKLLANSWVAHHDRLADLAVDKVHKGGVFAIYRLFNRYYLKSFIGPFFAFVFPVLVYAILGSLMNPYLLFAGITGMTAMSSGITGMPFSILELKKSTLLKRIGASPVKPSKFTFVIITYFTGVILLSILWLMVWALILHRETSMFRSLGTPVGFFGYFYGCTLNIVMALSIGFAISSVAKSEVGAQAIGMIIYFPCAFLSGQFIAIDIVARVTVMEWISRFLPTRYTTMIIVESWNGDMPPELLAIIPNASSLPSTIFRGNPFLIHDYAAWNENIRLDPHALLTSPDKGTYINQIIQNHNWAQIIYHESDHIVAYVYPYATLLAAGAFSIRKFSWSA